LLVRCCLQRRCIESEVTYLRHRCRGNLFTESLPNSERLFWLRYSGYRASYQNMYIVEKLNSYEIRKGNKICR
jgi:hypothetical protein